MSRLGRMTQWVAGGTSLRALDRANAGDPAEQPFAAQSERYEVGDDLEAEVGRQLADFEADDSRLPGERLPVYRSVGCWRDDKGQLCLTIHGLASEAAFARGECVLGQGSLWQEAAALSFLTLPISYFDPPAPPAIGLELGRRNRHDVRPALLLLMHAEDLSGLADCIRYGANYLMAWRQANNFRVSPSANLAGDAANLTGAGDALALIFRTRERRCGRRITARLNIPSLEERAKALGMRKADFARLRDLMAKVYAQRLREAESRFLRCADYVAPKVGASHASGFATETWWRPERSPPANS